MRTHHIKKYQKRANFCLKNFPLFFLCADDIFKKSSTLIIRKPNNNLYNNINKLQPMLQKNDFIHPEDAAALDQLESIPGFKTIVKKFLSIGAEQMQYGMNMASSIRLSPTQLPELYNHLPPICKKLGIEEPEFYLTMSPEPNAWTFGDTRVFITITSGLVEYLSSDELDAVLAHECGHVLLRHVLYQSIAGFMKDGLNALGLLGPLAMPVELAFYYWQRKSELSADRVSCFITSPETTARVMARLSGGPTSITGKINLEEWAKQADKYEEIRTDDTWNKTLQLVATAWLSHPFAAVRVREILRWADSSQYKMLASQEGTRTLGTSCPNCGAEILPNWQFCKICGRPLKKD